MGIYNDLYKLTDDKLLVICWEELENEGVRKKYTVGSSLVLPKVPSEVIKQNIKLNADLTNENTAEIEGITRKHGIDTIVLDNLNVAVSSLNALIAVLGGFNISLSNRCFTDADLNSLFLYVKCERLEFKNNTVQSSNLRNMFSNVRVDTLDIRGTKFMGSGIDAREMFQGSIIRKFLADEGTFKWHGVNNVLYATRMFQSAIIDDTITLRIFDKEYLSCKGLHIANLFECAAMKELDLRGIEGLDCSHIFRNTFVYNLLFPSCGIDLSNLIRRSANGLGHVHNLRVCAEYSGEYYNNSIALTKMLTRQFLPIQRYHKFNISNIRSLDMRTVYDVAIGNYSLSEVIKHMEDNISFYEKDRKTTLEVVTDGIIFIIDKKIRLDSEADKCATLYGYTIVNKDSLDSIEDYAKRLITRKKALGLSSDDITKIIVRV